MTAPIDLYNRALSRIGTDQFLNDPQEKSKAGTLFRQWYDTCVRDTLVDAAWNFATRVVALALLDGDPPPGWGFKYAYPTDCLQARNLSDSSGTRTYLSGIFACAPCQPQIDDWAGFPRNPVPFIVMSESTGVDASRRIICTDLDEAFLVYTANVTDPNLFSDGFNNAVVWRIAAEISSTFLGAPTGPQVAQTCGKYYRDALATAGAQMLNESGADYPRQSEAILARY